MCVCVFLQLCDTPSCAVCVCVGRDVAGRPVVSNLLPFDLRQPWAVGQSAARTEVARHLGHPLPPPLDRKTGREMSSPWSKIWWSCLSVSALTNLKKKHLNTPPGVCLWGQRRGHVGGGASDLSNSLHGGVKPLARMNSNVCFVTSHESLPCLSNRKQWSL